MRLSKYNRSMLCLLRKMRRKKKWELLKDRRNIRLIVQTKFLQYVCDDIKFIKRISRKSENERYIVGILRSLAEQVILFNYLMKTYKEKPNIFKDYMGCLTDISKIKDGKYDFEKLKNLIGNRTKLYSNNFKNLAKEFEDIDDETSFFHLYCSLADLYHNAYFCDITRDIFGKGKMDEKYIDTVILTILTQFYVPFKKK